MVVGGFLETRSFDGCVYADCAVSRGIMVGGCKLENGWVNYLLSRLGFIISV